MTPNVRDTLSMISFFAAFFFLHSGDASDFNASQMARLLDTGHAEVFYERMC